jgi:trehalose synthase
VLYDRVSAVAACDAVAAVGQGDVVVLHDAQTAGLVAPLVGAGAVVVWRCHVGADEASDPVRSAWRFLLPRVAPAHVYVFTRDAFIPPELRGSRAWRLTPAIDPCSAKNRPLDRTACEAILAACGMLRGPGTPARVDGVTVGARRRCEVVGEGLGASGTGERLVVALSRWDRLKDPVGIVRGFAEYVEHPAARLVLAGPRSMPSPTTPRAQAFSPKRGERGGSCLPPRARVYDWRSCPWTIWRRTP